MSLTIARLRFLNWQCFEGETVLDLEPKAYGVFAARVGDPDSSNWAGKTATTAAIDYALTGRVPKPTAERPQKSGWITDGQEKGEVDVTLSDGTRVLRTMSRKGSEKLYCFPPGDPVNAAYQEMAQQKIDELLGLTKEDAATWCLRQGEMSGLLKMDPGPRLEMFSTWFRLGALEDCQATASAARGEIEKQRATVVSQFESWRLSRRRQLDVVTLAPGQTIDDAIFAANLAYESSLREVELLETLEREDAERRSLAADAVRYDQIVVEGTMLVQQLREMDSAESYAAEAERVGKEVAESSVEVDRAATRYRTLAVVVAGNFDGRCPVAGAPCPSSAFVTETVQQNRDGFVAAKSTLDEWQGALVGARNRSALIAGKIRVRQNIERRLQVLRAAAGPRVERKRRWEALGGADVAGMALPPDDVRERLAAARRRLQELESVKVAVADADREIARLQAEVDRLERLAHVPTAAALVFERARREIAEGVLDVIEGYANEVLGLVGAELDVKISWGRDGAGLADACASCGAAFPASRKVKHCARCGAERGQKVTERLEVIPSRISGAANDLVGIAITLGASRWLREERESEWSTATIDEPTAAFDGVNVRAFMNALPRAMKSSGFDQVFVIAHHRGALDGMPGRIQVTADGKRSTVRVVV